MSTKAFVIIISCMQPFFNWVQGSTERYLTKRRAKKLKEKQNRSFKTEILGWVDAIVFAVVVVFILNQFFFQFFVIPSPSMLETLQVQDRVMVSKLTYGIQLFPQGPKILDSRIPDRDDIITFYNPQYESRGPFFNVFSQILYMITFSLVNIDRNPDGSVRESLLVKRNAGAAGDTVTFIDGDAYFKYAGTDSYVSEADFRLQNGMSTAPHRTIEKEAYTWYDAMGRINGLTIEGVSSSNVPRHLVNDYQAMDNSVSFTDYYSYNKQTSVGQMMADPTDMQARSTWAKYQSGVYVPEGHVLPLGDNRDNSQDGRYFGPVDAENVNGRVVFRIWPLNRIESVIGQ